MMRTERKRESVLSTSAHLYGVYRVERRDLCRLRHGSANEILHGFVECPVTRNRSAGVSRVEK